MPFFDFSCLRSRSLQIILLSTFLTSFGLLTPFLLLILDTHYAMEMGLAWVGGVFMTGIMTVSSLLPRHSRQYLCIGSGLCSGLTLMLHHHVGQWPWIAGIFIGSYHYSLKMFVFKKVRARNFARAWSLVQASQSLSVLCGVTIASNIHYQHYFAGISIIIGSLTLFLLNLHRHRLKKQKLRRQLARTKSDKSDATTVIEDPESIPPEYESVHKPERRPSFPEEEDDEELLVGGVSIQKLEEGGELCEMEYDMLGDDMEDHDYEIMDNITSCNVVDNYLMLDEYEQNLCKEHEQPPVTGLRRLRKWSLVRQASSQAVETQGGRKRSVNNNVNAIQGFFNNKRAITTIQETDVGMD